MATDPVSGTDLGQMTTDPVGYSWLSGAGSPTTPTTDGTAGTGTDPSQITAPSAPAGTTAAPSTSGNWLSDIGSAIQSPLGQVATAAIPAAVGLYQSGQATKQAQQLANQVIQTGAPAGTFGNQVLGQVSGGAPVPGQTGQNIAGLQTAAGEQTQVAQTYGTGNLTPAQNSQVTSYVQQQRAMVDAQLGPSGNLNSSARAQAYQQIDNNAAQLSQNLVLQNQSVAQGAMQAVTGMYQSLVSNAVNAAGLAYAATATGVKQLIGQNSQIASYVQQMLAGIAGGLSMASGKPQPTTGAAAGTPAGVGGQLATAVSNWAQPDASQYASTSMSDMPGVSPLDLSSTDTSATDTSLLSSATQNQLAPASLSDLGGG